MKCLLVEGLPQGPEWTYEIKFDGFRALAIKQGKEVTLLSRNQKSLNGNFPAVVKAVRSLSAKTCVLDGEIVALDEHGRSSFQFLQGRDGPAPDVPIYFYVFDLLHLNGQDLHQSPLEERKGLLEAWELPEGIRLSHALPGDAKQITKQLQGHGLEGIIAKLRGSQYEIGQRTGAWRKFKWTLEQEFVIGGYTLPEGSRAFFGALLVGYFAGAEFHFVSKIGTGYSARTLETLYKRFQKIRLPTCPFVNLPEPAPGFSRADMRRSEWVSPEFVCQVRFTEWTRDGHLRHPSFLGLREDKNPREVVKEEPA